MVDAWDEHYATEAGARYYPNEELVRFVSGREFDTVLDAGCGTGANLKLLLSHANMVAALDGNEGAISKAQHHMQSDSLPLPLGAVQWHRGDVCNMPWSDGMFDLVVDCMTSQHIPWAEHAAVYREYRRVLRPGGWLWLFHLDSETRCRQSTRAEDRNGMRECSYLSLFPTLDLFCLPGKESLRVSVGAAGLRVEERRGLKREYPSGDVASYTVISACNVK